MTDPNSPSTLTFRPANPNTDFTEIAALLSAAEPERTTADDLHEDEARLVPNKIRRRWVAEARGRGVVGYGLAVHYPSQGPGTFNIQVIVTPERQRQGIGSHLYELALACARQHGAHTLYCDIEERFPAGLRFAQQRGFQVDVHEIGGRLDLTHYDETAFADALAAVAGQGIRFTTYAAEGDTAANRRRLYEINRIATVDDPGTTGTFPDFEVWCGLIVDASGFQPEGQILAIDTRRDDAAYIGLSGIAYLADLNAATTLLTGVAASYRGQGIGLALKLHALRFAQQHGASYVMTRVDARNHPMLAINTRLGFAREPGFFSLSQSLT